MKPFKHAKGSVARWGGRPEDYMAIHDFIDQTKVAMPDLRHRAVLHNAFGCYLVERVFGHTLTNSDGREVSTRDVAERHIIEDMGFLPSLEDWLDELPQSDWHGGIHRLDKAKRARVILSSVQSSGHYQYRDVLSGGPTGCTMCGDFWGLHTCGREPDDVYPNDVVCPGKAGTSCIGVDYDADGVCARCSRKRRK